MAGFLDKKQRILDTIVTSEGRRQLAQGDFRARFYSFTDNATIYKTDTIVSGASLDETDRLILEVAGLPQDQITFEANDAGKLVAFAASGSERFSILEGQIFSGSVAGQRVIVTGSQFSSLSEVLLSGAIDSFKNQMILKSPDPLDDDERIFFIGPTEVTFSVTNTAPFEEGEVKEAKIDHIESLFQDKKLSHIPNFQFLPPVNKLQTGETERELLGNYVDLTQEKIETFEEIEEELSFYEQQTINFTETSTENNLVCQFFEVSGDAIKKLDVIDFGSFPDPEGGVAKRVFYVGKVYIDDMGTHTFVNLFSLIFE